MEKIQYVYEKTSYAKWRNEQIILIMNLENDDFFTILTYTDAMRFKCSDTIIGIKTSPLQRG